jgi:regulator of replication initiation timing
VKEFVTVKESHEKCHKEIEELENANERLTRDNKKLRMEVENFKRQISESDKSNR